MSYVFTVSAGWRGAWCLLCDIRRPILLYGDIHFLGKNFICRFLNANSTHFHTMFLLYIFIIKVTKTFQFFLEMRMCDIFSRKFHLIFGDILTFFLSVWKKDNHLWRWAGSVRKGRGETCMSRHFCFKSSSLNANCSNIYLILFFKYFLFYLFLITCMQSGKLQYPSTQEILLAAKLTVKSVLDNNHCEVLVY